MVAVILGGGRGTRLFPLTQSRSKPAVPLAGKFRLVDIPISACINSGLRQIFVLSQFQSASLNRHVSRTYRFDAFSNGFVEILAAEQTETSEAWYQGTADAVRKQLHRFLRAGTEAILILSGDQLYDMDFRGILDTHHNSGADITIAATPVTERDASQFGILQIGSYGTVADFVEKPRDIEVLRRLALDERMRSARGVPPERRYLASMGIYVFRPEVLMRVLEDPAQLDFGKEVIPNAIHSRRVHSHFYTGYWEDIGTIRTFFAANIDLALEGPPIDLFAQKRPIYTHPRFLPGTRLRGTDVRQSIICEGGRIDAESIERSIIGIRSVIGPGSQLSEVVMMGADYYEAEVDGGASPREILPIGIGAGCRIERAIIDKNARIGDHVVIAKHDESENADGPGFHIREGIVIVPKNGVVPAGSVI